ncbi:metalloprotease MmpA [Anaerotignum neopropionicum]|uniref:Zinc metalloprotease n=1 Tax=Anaerotignum neopropionicum TaxID=36847 RepID=A0A136WFC1_9FIRM|nr:RIP metalloprotease RseP [Anaerotignum neopropionicum]KXL53195.1 metalloprotease MmpA [Anaerotignum neopropionicum]
MFSIIISLILIGVLVIAHEFGHFIAAKKSGILVEEFSVGMGAKIFSHKKGETEYTIRLLPLGGFCRMQGEEEDGTIGPRSFFSKSVGVRFIVMAAGPFMNFVLAFIMIFGLTATSYMAVPKIKEVLQETPAQEIGLQAGDEIYRVNGKRIHIYDEMESQIYKNSGEEMRLDVLRDGQVYSYKLTPQYDADRQGYLIGFSPEIEVGLFAEAVEGYQRTSVLETMRYSYYSMLNYIKLTAEGLARVFTFTAKQEEFGGPISIVKMVGASYEAGLSYGLKEAIQNVIYIGAVLSANLGVLNLFPIPALDGGRILLLLVEAIRRKPLNPELESKIHFLGFAFLIGIMVFVLYGDIVKFFI